MARATGKGIGRNEGDADAEHDEEHTTEGESIFEVDMMKDLCTRNVYLS